MYTIKRAAELTGVPAATLRAWERRYDLVQPGRTDSGYRLYDDEAVARVRVMAALVADGWSASTAAAEVSRRRSSSASGRTAASRDHSPGAAIDVPAAVGASMTRRIVDAAATLDATGLERVLDERFALGSFESVVDEWLMPTLDEVGRAWADERISVAGEHLVAHAVLRRLGASFDEAVHRPDGPRVLVGLPTGVHHELGIFAFAVALRRLGVHVVYLGADLPTPAWSAALEAHGARCAVLSVPRRRDVRAAREVVAALRELDEGLMICVGGSHQGALVDPDVQHLGHEIGPAAARVAAAIAP